MKITYTLKKPFNISFLSGYASWAHLLCLILPHEPVKKAVHKEKSILRILTC